MPPVSMHRMLWVSAALLAVSLVWPTRSRWQSGDSDPRRAATMHTVRAVLAAQGAAPRPSPAARIAADPPRARPELRSGEHLRWPALLARSDAGDPQAACRLAELIDDCRLVADVGEMVETQISVAAADLDDAVSDADGIDAATIAALDVSVDPLRRRCADLPPALAQRQWSFLLRAAIAGHEPSMFRYVVDPPLPSSARHERATALAAYRENAALFVAHLLQRASPQALALGFRAAQGEAFVAGRPIQARDAASIVRTGTALLMLRDADSGSEHIVADAARELLPSQAQRARNEGRLLADRFLRASEIAPGTIEGDDCSAGWPGMRSELSPYTY